MMCGDRWLETGSPWEGDEMTEREPTEEMIMAGINAANRSMPYINDTQMVLAIWKAMQARATPALPQGVEEWIKQNKFSALSAGEFNEVVSMRDLRAYLSGMAIVPSEGIKIEAGSEAYQEVIVTAPDGGQQIFWPEDAAHGLMKAMLAAAKEQSK